MLFRSMPTTIVQSSRFSFRVNTSSINLSDMNFDFYGQNLDMTIYWGDGTSDFFTGNSMYNPSHSYPSLGSYTIEVEVPVMPNACLFQLFNTNTSLISNISSLYGNTIAGSSTIAFQLCNLSSSDVNNVLAQCVALNWNSNAILLYQKIGRAHV